jgi:dienelactone hydrolase
MHLHVIDTGDGLVDSPVRFQVTGTSATTVDLDVYGVDANGRRWRSSGRHPVGGNGLLDIADNDEPWVTMQPVVTSRAVPTLFEACDSALEFTATASDGSEVSSTTLRRVWGRGLVCEDLRGPGWELHTYRPADDDSCLPGVIVVPGTMVTRSTWATAALFASHGYATAVLAYTGRPGLPDSVARIPVEAIADGIEAFTARPYVDDGAVAIHASSIGVQTALTTVAMIRSPLRAIVAVAPSHVVFQSLRTDGPPEQVSSLTHEGIDLPYVPVRAERLLGQVTMNMVRRSLLAGRSSMAMATTKAYEAGLRDHHAVADAAIPVERIDCPILAIAGTNDRCYPAAEMARAIIDRRIRLAADRCADDELLIYPRVGHFIRPPAVPTTVTRSAGLIGGGTPEDVATAQRNAWTRTLEFLLEHLS